MRTNRAGMLLGVLSVFPVGALQAAEPCTPWVAKIVSIEGRVEASHIGEPRWVPARLKQTFCPGDRVRIESRSRAAVLLPNQTVLRLDEGTALTFTQVKPAEPSLLDLLKGAIHFLSRTPAQLRINTPFSAAGVEGTEFVLRVTENATQLWVFEGRVRFADAQGSLMLASGEAAAAQAGRAPQRRVVVRPREAVQWALYYPPLIDYRLTSYPSGPGGRDITEALKFYRHDDLASAFATLDKVPDEVRDASYYTLSAGLLLNVGRVDEARADIDRALRFDPKNATAYALQSVIAMVQNEREQALYLARKAEELDPQSPIPKVALSYAYQAKFDIEKALENIEQAIALAPTDALAYARLAELQLSRGDLERAVNAAKTAVALDPDLARTQAVLGFAYLTEIDIDQAKATFQKAIELDPASPLPRLGLGLAKIRDGDLREGTQEIEIAASLDPNNSLVRSYLGKAYFEEKRGGLASSEFEIAKALDPNDPTPWFYDAIHKQTTNRPVEALHDLQKAIELNDNRAVYRSKLLLDEDLAARSAALGRIYNDLGFQQLGLVEGWKSVNTDPSNYSAHRLLADNYAALPRHEIARVSELLQSQLLQPVNITPVQPQLAESNLLILEGAGPAAPAFNEFNPLFHSNRLALQASGVVGNNDSYGDELVQSGVWDNLSYSLGQLHYETAGFRQNNDLKHDIYTVFAQVSLLPKVILQGEFRDTDTESGDLRSRFNGVFSPNERRAIRNTSGRLGFRYTLTTHSDLIGSLVYSSLDDELTDNEQIFTVLQDVPVGEFFLDMLRINEVFQTISTVETESLSGELQYQNRFESLDFVLGAGQFADDRKTVRVDSRMAIFPDFPEFNEADIETLPIDRDTDHTNAYAYSHLNLFNRLNITLGVSFDSFDNIVLERHKVNPKLGLQWEPLSGTTFRAAWFKTLKRPFVANQTIEPTQIAGFNQFFDDTDGAETTRFGAAVDQRFGASLFVGVEGSWRELERPIFGPQTLTTAIEEQNEQLHRGYIYWTPTSYLALGGEYVFEKSDRSRGSPSKITTHSVPLSASYFHPGGFFARLGSTFVDQKVEEFRTNFKDSEQFWLVDASIGYRLPRRWGIAAVGVKNLFDEDFRFEDVNFQSGEPLVPSFIPDRLVFVHLTLSF